MAEVEFLREKIKALERDKDSLHVQLNKATRGVAVSASQRSQGPSLPFPQMPPENVQLQLEQLRLEIVRLSSELSGKTSLISSLQLSLAQLEADNLKIKEEATTASLSMELEHGNVFDDDIGKVLRADLIATVPAELREFLLVNNARKLCELGKYLNPSRDSPSSSAFLPRFIKALWYLYPSCTEILRDLIKDLRIGNDVVHLQVIQTLIESGAISDQSELWSVLTRVCEVLKRQSVPQEELFSLAAAAVRFTDFSQVKRITKELTDMVLCASHSLAPASVDAGALAFLDALAMRSPDIVGLASLRCNGNCLNIAQRLVQYGVNGAFTVDGMPPAKMKMTIRILSKMVAVRSERGGRSLELQFTLSSTAQSLSEVGKTVQSFRPPPIIGHLIDFLGALIDAIKLRPIYRQAVNACDLKIVSAFYSEWRQCNSPS